MASSMRGSRVGAGPMGEAERDETAPTVRSLYPGENGSWSGAAQPAALLPEFLDVAPGVNFDDAPGVWQRWIRVHAVIARCARVRGTWVASGVVTAGCRAVRWRPAYQVSKAATVIGRDMW